MKHLHFKLFLFAVSCCLMLTATLTAVRLLSSIKTANADVRVDCYSRNEGILFKCNERNTKHCATTYISVDGEVTAAICHGDWIQQLEPVDEVLPPDLTTTEN